MTSLVCTTCGMEKIMEEDFFKDSRSKKGYKSSCKDCHNIMAARGRELEKATIRALTKERKKVIPLEGEEWKDIPGYEGIYKISTLGRVWGVVRAGGGGMLTPNLNKKKGYYFVCLRKDKTNHIHEIHRLVALTFIPGNFPGAVVDHIDRNKTNNSIQNLRWVTQSQNNLNKEIKGCVYKEDRKLKKTLKDGTVKEYPSTRYIAQYRDVRGRVLSKGFKTEQEAQVQLEVFKQENKR